MNKQLSSDINELCLYALELANESEYRNDYEEVSDLVRSIQLQAGHRLRYEVRVPDSLFSLLKAKFVPENLKFGWLKPSYFVIEATNIDLE